MISLMIYGYQVIGRDVALKHPDPGIMGNEESPESIRSTFFLLCFISHSPIP